MLRKRHKPEEIVGKRPADPFWQLRPRELRCHRSERQGSSSSIRHSTSVGPDVLEQEGCLVVGILLKAHRAASGAASWSIASGQALIENEGG
jgi:hypothetical protein